MEEIFDISFPETLSEDMGVTEHFVLPTLPDTSHLVFKTLIFVPNRSYTQYCNG